jgi:hypothetical protein
MTADSPPNGRKPGRPRDPILEDIRHRWLPLRSERSRARYKKAIEQLIAAGCPIERLMEIQTECCRANGTLNIHLFARYAAYVAAHPIGSKEPNGKETATIDDDD